MGCLCATLPACTNTDVSGACRIGAVKKQTLCLCMIVKNEAQVIERCLSSVRHLIDHWVISDTGSTDGTQELIRKTLDGIPGELHEEPWVDFGHNRTANIQRARGKADYLLTLDADHVMRQDPAAPADGDVLHAAVRHPRHPAPLQAPHAGRPRVALRRGHPRVPVRGRVGRARRPGEPGRPCHRGPRRRRLPDRQVRTRRPSSAR
ncbi:glycosyltransferase [Streptomyces graminilatus]|uniref:glycosyltransferase n=1 Tax=Streptomyces graminilatus TaxID=1464070 RepID=UPI0030CA4310